VDGYLADVPMGTDDTEYAVLTAWAMLRHGRRLTAEDVSELWRTHLLGQTGGFEGGGFSEHGAISNLRRGLVAPVTGSDNHERWSDGCAMRVVGIGVYCAGDPTEAARLTAIEGSVSHAGDGIRCGQVIAAGVAAAMTATDWAETVDAILDTVGDDSWTGRAVRRAAEIGTTASSLQPVRFRTTRGRTSLPKPWPWPWASSRQLAAGSPTVCSAAPTSAGTPTRSPRWPGR
jgi:ADP-ribosylglycohydrolase